MGLTTIPEFVEASYAYYDNRQHPFDLPLALTTWGDGETYRSYEGDSVLR